VTHPGSGWDDESARKDTREGKNARTNYYGLMGLAAMLVIAFYFAYADEFSPVREQLSLDLVNNARLSEPCAMKNGMLTAAFGRGQVEVFHG
jgi:hypothetical protein